MSDQQRPGAFAPEPLVEASTSNKMGTMSLKRPHRSSDGAFEEQAAPKKPRARNVLGELEPDSDEDAMDITTPQPSTVAGFAKKPPRHFAMTSSSTTPLPSASRYGHHRDAGIPPQATGGVSKPTILLASIPMDTSKAQVAALVADCGLRVDELDVFVPPEVSKPGSSIKLMQAAVVVLHQKTPDPEIAAAVSTLNNKYLGKGYFLWATRHRSTLASAHTNARDIMLPRTLKQRPFGAHRVAVTAQGFTVKSEPEHEGTVAAPPGGSIQDVVFVKRPRDKKLVATIHKVVEQCIKYGPRFECDLMAMPKIQNDKTWAWLWDKRSEAGTWYMWRMWELESGFSTRSNPEPGSLHRLVEAGDAPYFREPPVARFEFVTDISELAKHRDWQFMMEAHDEFGAGVRDAADDPLEDLNPYRRWRLIWMLAGLPRSLARLQNFHLLSVVGLCYEWVSCGADEIVEILIENVIRPYSITSRDFAGGAWDYGTEEQHAQDRKNDAELDPTALHPDYSSAMIVGMAILDVLLTNSRARQIRRAEKYVKPIENGLIKGNVFQRLAERPNAHAWQPSASDRWRRSLKRIIEVWQNGGFFRPDTYKLFKEQAGLPSTLDAELAYQAPGQLGQSAQQSYRERERLAYEHHRDSWKNFQKEQ